MATGGVIDLERDGDETFDFLCVVCKGKNKNSEAEMFCSECHDYYCSSCVKCHDVIPPLKTHQILDKSTAPPPAVPTERCKDHKDKPVDMYCENHNVVGCSICMLVKHSSCKDKLYIPDFIKTNRKAANSIKVEKKLERIAESLNALQEAFVEDKEELKSHKIKVLKEIGQFRQKINKLLDQFENNVVQELEQRFKSLTDQFDSSLNELQATSTEIQVAQDRLKSAGGNMPQKFASIMQANQVVSNAEEKVMTSESEFCPTEIAFLANQKLQTLFSEIQDFGSVSLRVREKLRIPGKQEYRVDVKSDSYICYIISACTLNDSTIILADHRQSILKRLDSSLYTVTDCNDIPLRPKQVCAISDTEVAVSCTNSKLIQFVNVGRTMMKTRQIKTDFECQGLAYGYEKLFVSDRTSVYMFSLSGERLQQLYNDQSVRKRLYMGIQALAFYSDKSRICVSDHEKGLIIMDMNGQLVGQYNGKKLRGSCHVCLDNNDNVLVCGLYSKNVLQLSPDGKLISEILKIDRYCSSVCCNKNNSKLIVCLGMRNAIRVYDINAE